VSCSDIAARDKLDTYKRDDMVDGYLFREALENINKLTRMLCGTMQFIDVYEKYMSVPNSEDDISDTLRTELDLWWGKHKKVG
jgi:hypothetical protein